MADNVWNRYHKAADILNLDERIRLELTSYKDVLSGDLETGRTFAVSL
jgi:hypothetical protein